MKRSILAIVLLVPLALLGCDDKPAARLPSPQGRPLSAAGLDALLLLNPTDVYRLFNLTGSANVSTFAGMVGLAQSTSLTSRILLFALICWTSIPLALAAIAFSRREL